MGAQDLIADGEDPGAGVVPHDVEWGRGNTMRTLLKKGMFC